MSDLSKEIAVGQFEAVLREAFEGSPEKWSYFTDPGPEGAFFGTLARLSASEASRLVAGSTIAAHVHHVAFSLDASAAWIRGERASRDWKASWRVSLVDDREWAELQETVRARYRDFLAAIAAHGTDDEDSFGGAVGAIAHMAYHLGAIRQKAAYGRQV